MSNEVDVNEAPEGYVAQLIDKEAPHPCIGCAFYIEDRKCVKDEDFLGCFSDERTDGCEVIFVRKENTMNAVTTEQLIEALVIAIKCNQALDLPYLEAMQVLENFGYKKESASVAKFIKFKQKYALKLLKEHKRTLVC